MKYFIGIDTGTTSISMTALNDSYELIESRTLNHDSFIKGEFSKNKIQDPERIKNFVFEILDEIILKHGKPSGIGFTGQMHGMLYVDKKGNSTSPLYTWQDESGNIPFKENKSSLQILKENGLNTASGYGLATHFYLQNAGKIPENAAKMSTISDYIAMKLCGNNEPVLSSDMAASWGCFDIKNREFFYEKLNSIGVKTSYFPKVIKGYGIIGQTLSGVPVISSMGDNQASVKGAFHSKNSKNLENGLLINIGTGSQVSLVTKKFFELKDSDIEIRPYDDIYLLAGSGLCGGRAYAMLENFYRSIGGRNFYEIMQKDAEEFFYTYGLEKAWKVTTSFSGTRSDPDKKGSISGISVENFCPSAFTLGVIEGILNELYIFYSKMKALTGREAEILAGSGNGLRKNSLMQKIAEKIFNMKLNIPEFSEEAAAGAALCAGEKI